MSREIAELVHQLSEAIRPSLAQASFCIGTVQQAGRGRLRVGRGSLILEREDLYVDPTLKWNWEEDTGAPELLRPGDRVVLLTEDEQTYYLICRVVRP